MVALGNRATKTAKNIRRKSRRKPRKYRTPINTRKRVGGGYDGLWRDRMATRPNRESNEILTPYKDPHIYEPNYEDKDKDKYKYTNEEIRQLVADIVLLENDYTNMEFAERAVTRDIEHQILVGRLVGSKRGSKRNLRNPALEDYTARFIIVRDIWNSMSNDEKDSAFNLFKTTYDIEERDYIINGPYYRTFGEFIYGYRLR